MKLSIPKAKPIPTAADIVIPDGFKLIIDTREQLPLFTNLPNLPVVRKSIKNGDYSIEGFEGVFSIERKMLSDFFGYIGKERDKTIRKLRRLREFEVAILVVEASLDDLLAPQIYTQMQPGHVFGFIKSLIVRYGITPVFHRDRAVIERIVLESAVYYYEIKTGGRP